MNSCSTPAQTRAGHHQLHSLVDAGAAGLADDINAVSTISDNGTDVMLALIGKALGLKLTSHH
ncbi:MAG: hypothetical protein AB8G77_27535 [Rhodothermales bacterium]